MNCLLLLVFSCLFTSLDALIDMDVSAKAAILINAESGQVLYEKNPDLLLPPASTTKVATAAYILHLRGDKLDNLVEAKQDAIGWISEDKKISSGYSLPAYWLEPGASHVSIQKGETLTLRELMYAMMIASADDASNVLAQYIGGTIPTFMEDLNRYLREIGCESTTFYNPHGLHHPKHLTTARELALLTQTAMKNPQFCEIVKMARYDLPKSSYRNETAFLQTNRLMRKGRSEYYPRAIGVKTGYTSKAGHCLISAAQKDDRVLIAVMLGCPSRKETFEETKRLFETAFKEKPNTYRLFKKGVLPLRLIHPRIKKEIKVQLKNELKVAYYRDSKPSVKCQVQWKSIELPLEPGQHIGDLVAINQLNGAVLAEEPVYSVDPSFKSFKEKVRSMPLGGKFVFGMVVLSFTWLILRRGQ
ncbi:MAG: D-alanyl-D-alanine carboxypeptidase family protein [Waddliaceae bacterium]